MVNAMEWLYSQEKYNTREKREEVRQIGIEGRGLEGHLDLREFVNLTDLFCSCNKLTSLDVSQNVNLNRLFCWLNNFTFLKVPDGLYWKMWTKIKNNTKPVIPNLIKLIDISDLDNWVKNYDESKVGDIEYHKFCGSNSRCRFSCLDYIALDNLGNKIIARKLIVLSRLLTPAEDLPKNKLYEEEMNEFAEWYQACGCMNLPGKTPDNPWTEAEQEEVVIKALSGDKSLLIKLQDLPYLNPEYKSKNTLKLKIQELQNQTKELQSKIQATEQELTNTKQQLTQIQAQLTNQDQQLTHKDQTITHLEQQKTQTNQTITNLQGQMEVKKTELQQQKNISNKLSSELETAKEKNQSYLENIKRKEEIINDNNQQIKQLKSQLQTSQTELTTQSTINQDLTNAIKQLQSKIKLLEQQKENYQTKYDKSIEFIKEIREDIIKM